MKVGPQDEVLIVSAHANGVKLSPWRLEISLNG